MLFGSLLFLGFISIVAQAVLMRELMVSFYGNEFFIGWALFSWLFWTAAGSFAVKPLKLSFSPSKIVICHFAASVLFPLEIIAVRSSKGFLTPVTGQIPDVLGAMAVSFVVMAPLCFFLGFWFSLIVSQNHVPPSRAYYYETLGYVLGGLVFSYYLVFLNEFQLSAILILLNTAVAFGFLYRKRCRWIYAAAAATAFAVGLACLCYSPWLELKTAGLRFPQQQLVATQNSVFGNLAVTRTGDQYNFYHSGQPQGAQQDEAYNERIVHFAMLSNPHPQKILLLGTGFNGALKEILKYHPQEVFYAELDPALPAFAKPYLSASSQQDLGDKRVHLIQTDLKSTMQLLPDDLDVVMINLPNPSTALINRYFTVNFFDQISRHLSPEAVLSTHLSFQADAISPFFESLGACMYKSLKSVFPSIILLPEEELLILASRAPLASDPGMLMERMRQQGIQNHFVTADYIRYRYTNDRRQKVLEGFAANKVSGRNFDLYPRGYLYQLACWLSVFHRDLAGLYVFGTRIPYIVVLGFGVLPLLLLILWRTSPGLKPYAAILSMSVGGFSLMSAEVLMIYLFQVYYGNLYYKIAWIITVFMAGMAAGTFVAGKSSKQSFKLAFLHGCIGLCFVFWFLCSNDGWPLLGVWYLIAFTLGALVGMEYVVLAAQYSAGMVYAADLAGAALGALALGFFLVPAYGVPAALLWVASLNAALAVLLARLA